MSTRQLTINIDTDVRQKLIDGGYRLCFSFAVNGQFNVVASTTTLTAVNTIEWTETYSMAAGIQTFKAGDVVMKGQSEQRQINFGQKYKLPDWKSSSVISDPDVPSASLGFFNGVQAAPVISMITNGVATPIFIDTVLPARVNSTYTPVCRVKCWFDRYVKTSTMIVEGMIANPHEINMTGKNKSETTYTNSGDWTGD